MTICLGDTPSIAQHFLGELRDIKAQINRQQFRFNMEKLGEIMAFEISKKLFYNSVEIQTSLGVAQQKKLTKNPVLICILRAAIPFWQGFQRIFDQSDSGFIGAYRQEEKEIKIKVDYVAVPPLAGRDVILIDPMLATGKSLVDTATQLFRNGKPDNIFIASLIASPEGIAFVEKMMGHDISIWTFSIDKTINQNFYIVPGMGDAGDLSFGEKV